MKNSSYAQGMSYEALLQNTLGGHDHAAKTFQIMLDAAAGHWSPKPAATYVPEVKKKMLKAIDVLIKRKELKSQTEMLSALRNRLEQTIDPNQISDILQEVDDVAFPLDPNDPFYVALSQS